MKVMLIIIGCKVGDKILNCVLNKKKRKLIIYIVGKILFVYN